MSGGGGEAGYVLYSYCKYLCLFDMIALSLSALFAFRISVGGGGGS